MLTDEKYVYCKDTLPHLGITPNKRYKYSGIKMNRYRLVCDDDGTAMYYRMDLFYTKSEFRSKKLEDILWKS